MIKLKLSFGDDSSEKFFDYVKGESLDKLVNRVLADVDLLNRNPEELFNVVVNGHLIEKDFWPMTLVDEKTIVVVSPKMTSGESGQIFKGILILAITVVAVYFAGPAGLGVGPAAAAAIAGAVNIAATLLLNALIPPPVLKAPELGQGYENSQTYSITGQSNAVKRFETVPKVYGAHRIFPNVAANPYTELENDPVANELVQYLYAVYDFGLGPLDVRDIQIGDTPLIEGNFSGFSYRLVDPNKPDISEGPWDDALQKEFSFYKGDSESTALGVGLNGNEYSGTDPQQSWEAIRNSSPNTDGTAQEIILNFANPTGLYAFAGNGVRVDRQIDMDISFSKVGEDVWRKYNDPNYVSNFSAAGGDNVGKEINVKVYNGPVDGGPYYSIQSDYEEYWDGRIATSAQYNALKTFIRTDFQTGQPVYSGRLRYRKIVPKAGQNKLVLEYNYDVLVGNTVSVSGVFAGVITAIEPFPDDANYRVITMDRPLEATWHTQNMWVGNLAGTMWDRINPAQLTGFNYARIYTYSQGAARIKRNSTSPVYSTFKFTPKEPGQYRVKVRRLTSSSQFTASFADELVWGSIITRFDRAPIITDKRHVFLELKIRATSQLNGNISNLSAVCKSALEVYDADTQTWSRQLTNNPAWVFTDLLIGEVNKKKVDKNRLHLPSIVEWAEFCDVIPTAPPSREVYEYKRFTTDFILDYPSTLQQVLNQVSNAAQASLNITDGKYGVLIDRYRDVPVQIFTPRNSRDFGSVRNYGPRPHGLKVRYIDPALNWEPTEVIAYDDGYDKDNAEEFDELTSFGCTTQEQAWRFGRYMIAQNKLRQETISITIDFEHLVCTRGDYVQITQDVMRVGGKPARVKTVAGTVITFDDALDVDPDLDYGYHYRSSTGEIKNSTLTMLTPRSADVDGDIPAVGDLIVIGETGKVVYDCIVKAISPENDLSATLILVEKADAIYDYESSGSIPDYDPQISATSDPNFRPPGPVENLVVSDVAYDCSTSGSGYDYYIELTWDPPQNAVYEFFTVYVDTGLGFEEVGNTRSTVYRYVVPSTRMDMLHSFKVVAVSATGKKLLPAGLMSVSATPTTKTTAPSDVEKLNSDITNEVLQLSWPPIADCDAQKYVLRFSPSTSATWETSLPLLAVDARTTSASFQARTGTYLIKALDFAGNISVNAALTITTIPNLFNLNIIDEIDDTPTFDGGTDRVGKVGSALVLNQDVPGVSYYNEGYYYFSDLLDLGEIYSTRLQSVIQAEGYTSEDLMMNWVTLDSVLLLSNAKFADWDVETQYRSTDNLNVIAEWDTLDEVTAMNGGADDNFTEWRTFTIGDATGRVFQFRLRLLSYRPNVSPRVFSGLVRADMPDRLESYENLVADVTDGYEVEYSPAFKGPGLTPNVQVSIDDAESGDYWSFDYKTLDGFLIRFFDRDDNPVSRQFDVSIKGYGRKANSII